MPREGKWKKASSLLSLVSTAQPPRSTLSGVCKRGRLVIVPVLCVRKPGQHACFHPQPAGAQARAAPLAHCTASFSQHHASPTVCLCTGTPIPCAPHPIHLHRMLMSSAWEPAQSLNASLSSELHTSTITLQSWRGLALRAVNNQHYHRPFHCPSEATPSILAPSGRGKTAVPCSACSWESSIPISIIIMASNGTDTIQG